MTQAERAPARVILKRGHVRPVWAGHPWVYSQAVERIVGQPDPGDEVVVVDGERHELGRGLYSPSSAIRVRLYSRDPAVPLDGDFFASRLERAERRRQRLGLPNPETTGYRAVYGEGDGLPGLIVDRYGSTAVVQFGTAGLHARKKLLAGSIADVLGVERVLDRTGDRAAVREGFQSQNQALIGDEPAILDFTERGLRYRIPIELKQKTGFYLDQRPVRERVETLARGLSVLDTYCYVGSFAAAAARGGAARVSAADTSQLAIQTARTVAKDNGLEDRIQFEAKPAQEALTEAADDPRDLVIIDPPKLADNKRSLSRAATALTRMAELGARATKPSGLLLLCSCSHAIGPLELGRAAAEGAVRAGRTAIVLERLFQGADHPTLAAFPEGLYLSALLLEIAPA